MLGDLKFVISQETLTQTIEALRELRLRLEIDASAFALIHSRESDILAEERLEQAETVRNLLTSLRGETNMSKGNNLRNLLLSKLREERQVVTLIFINGFQMKGRITAFDEAVVVMEIRGEQQIVFRHAISTIVPGQPIDLGSLREEEPS